MTPNKKIIQKCRQVGITYANGIAYANSANDTVSFTKIDEAGTFSAEDVARLMKPFSEESMITAHRRRMALIELQFMFRSPLPSFYAHLLGTTALTGVMGAKV